VLPEPRVIADFALIDQAGQPFSLEQLRGSWSLIFFGFTHCPDVCPTALYELQQVRKSLQHKLDESTQMPEILFVSVDPERDTPEALRAYLSHFDPSFIGVTGKHEQLLPLTKQVGIAYRIEEHESGVTQYSVDHSTGILLTNPAGRLHGVFPAPHGADDISADLLATLAEADVY
jgi:protein SCO1/2